MLNYEFINVLDVIKSYGSFSKPVLNSLASEFSPAEMAFIFAVKYEYNHDGKNALSELKKIKNCHDKNLKYLLMMKKLELYRTLGKKRSARILYEKLRRSLADISPKIRESVTDELIAYVALSGENEDFGRFKLNGRCMSDSARIFFEMNKGRKLMREDNKDGLENFKNALRSAIKIFHPPGIVTDLNALSWYEKDYDIDQALKYGKEALYSAGLYFEGSNVLYVFDTIIEVMSKSTTNALTEILKDFMELYEKAPEVVKKGYKKRFTQAKHILSTTFYKLDGKTRRYLRKLDKKWSLEKSEISRKEIFNLIHSKVKNIRGETIRKILSANPELFEELESPKLPRGFTCEMAKKKEGLHDGIDSVVKNEKSLDPFIQARKDLTEEFLERMPKRTKERFIQGYLTLDEEERKVIDRFSRDYIRYDIRWGMRIKIPKEMERYAKSLRLKKTPAALAYWALDREHERKKLVEVFKTVLQLKTIITSQQKGF